MTAVTIKQRAAWATAVIERCNELKEGRTSVRTSLLAKNCGTPAPALRWLAEQMAVQGLEVEVHTAEGMREPRLGEDREDLLFNAVRELLINVRKHARFGLAKVCIAQHGTSDCHITVLPFRMTAGDLTPRRLRQARRVNTLASPACRNAWS
jgi:hypothetical protein